MHMLRKPFFGGVAAGLAISLGGAVYLACENRYIGALLFSVALLSICFKGYYLYTGKVGYIVESHKAADFASLGACLAGNAVATLAFGALIAYALPKLGESAEAMCTVKLAVPLLSVFIRAFFCGVLMYLAVSIYKEKNSALGILFCVPVFILSGFEHSVADMFYFGTALIYSPGSLLFIVTVVAGNSLGGTALPLISKAAGKD